MSSIHLHPRRAINSKFPYTQCRKSLLRLVDETEHCYSPSGSLPSDGSNQTPKSTTMVQAILSQTHFSAKFLGTRLQGAMKRHLELTCIFSVR